MPEYNDDLKVIVSMDRYAELIRKEAHYDNIIGAALEDATISSWRNKIDLSMDKVEDYIKVVERNRVYSAECVLKAQIEQREKAEEA